MSVSLALAKACIPVHAWSVLGPQSPEGYIGTLSEWGEGFDAISPDTFYAVLVASTRMISWVRPSWAQVSEILAGDDASESDD